jgi:hypothetical protein
MTGRLPVEPSAFSHFLATNYQKDPDYVVLTPGGEVLAAKWHRPAARTTTGVALAQHTLMYHAGGSTSREIRTWTLRRDDRAPRLADLQSARRTV